MPELRTLTPDEVARMQSRRGRTVDLTQYVEYLRDLSPGQMGEARLTDSEKKATIKRRLTAAAKRLNKGLKYRRSGENAIVFEVTSGGG